MKRRLLLLVAACLVAGIVTASCAEDVEARVEEILKQMTLEEKVALLSGKTSNELQDYPRLGVPSLRVTDGPHGVGWGVKSTCFPTGVGMASTWNPDLLQRVGEVLGSETRAAGRHVLLGPCVNIQRTPLGGRNFESFSEDPLLAARIAVAYVKGVQSQKIGTSVKHFACNNQEAWRMTVDTRVDERALREIYLPAFQAAVQEAGAWTVMCAYNKLNGDYCSANRYLLTDILKKEWGFKGFVVSDWGACHSTVPAANAGLDLEMDSDGPDLRQFFKAPLLKAAQEGQVSEAVIDDKVRRILRVIGWGGLLDGSAAGLKGELDTPAHRALAREVARESIVLVKNEGGLLPLDKSAIKSIAVIGPNAEWAVLGGAGSSWVTTSYAISPLEAVRATAGGDVTVAFAAGCRADEDIGHIDAAHMRPPEGREEQQGLLGEYFSNRDLSGEPVLTRVDGNIDFNWGGGSPGPEVPADDFSVRWTGKLVAPTTGTFRIGIESDDGMRMHFDGKPVMDMWFGHGPETRNVELDLEAGRAYDVRIEYFEQKFGAMARLGWHLPDNRQQEAIELAAKSDVAIVFAGLSHRVEGEGRDRPNMDLPARQAQLIQAVARANPRTVVVLVNGSPVEVESWVGQVPAVVETWYAGEEGGHAMAEVLFGEVNPSGKMPVTFPKRLEDNPSFGNYPGVNERVVYAEGLLVGYRHYDTKDIEPAIAFGHGLSYTKFDYSNLKVAPRVGEQPGADVSVDVENTGEREGREVVQLYVSDPVSSLPRPRKELKAFSKIGLKPGEKTTVSFALGARAFSFYDPEKKAWVLEPGEFEILVGGSSRDIRQAHRFSL